MIYNDFKGIKLSALGMGTMRLPVIEGKNADIDELRTAEMVAYAIKNGVNYFDTAWGYHGKNSETVIGKILSNYPRESYYLATKFPGYDLSYMPKAAEIFEEQLKKCRVDYFDFYLFHNVCEMNIEQYLDKSYGIYDYLVAQKKAGRIKYLGLSIHGSLEVLRRFLDAYGEEMDFCQVQLNYVDYSFQQADEKLKLLRERGLPVFVMEPLRGGKLAVLDDAYTEKLKSLRPEETVPGWAFRYLQSLPEVAVTLSGMSDFEQMRQNVETFKTYEPLSEEEMTALYGIASDMLSKKALPCTSCRYCVDYCPMGLDIPELIKMYNEHAFTGGGFIAPMRLRTLPEDKRPAACIACRSCEDKCPQHIKISEAMADFAERTKPKKR